MNLQTLYIKNHKQIKEAENSFLAFVRLFWPQVATTPLREGFYLEAICDHLQHLPQIKRLLINIPPRHGKSTLVAVLYPAWLWIQQPHIKFLCSTYSLKDLSIRDSIACRSVIESPLYQAGWGNKYQLSLDQNTKHRFSNNQLGFRLATSTESANIGEGCDILIADDLNNVAKVNSDAEREGVIFWWSQVISTRMNPGGLDCKVVIQQRCHEEDVSGYIIANDKANDWTRLILPYEFNPKSRTVTSLWQDPRTTDNQPLSDLLSDDKIRELKSGNGLGGMGFQCQYNQSPVPLEGNLFKRAYFKHYREDNTTYYLEDTPCLKQWVSKFITIDLAISLKQEADYTVASVWGITPHNNLLLLDEFRQRVEGPEAIKAFQTLYELHKPDCLYVEAVAYQKIMFQLLRASGLPTRELKTEGQDKKARCQKSLIKAECGQVWLPSSHWVDSWLDEVTAFPNGKHDDRVDTLAYAGIISSKYPVKALPKPKTAEELEREEVERQRSLMWGKE